MWDEDIICISFAYKATLDVSEQEIWVKRTLSIDEHSYL